MSANPRALEVHGEDVESAIDSGLRTLGAGRDAVAIEVLDEGSRGFLGIGGRNALVRLTLKDAPPAPALAAADTAADAEDQPPADENATDGPETEAALAIVRDLLDKMHIDATVSAHLSEMDEESGRQIPILEVRGRDLGNLIGPHGETLNALQYVARLILGHQQQIQPSFVLDVEGYRRRREQALARLAERMADKAVQTGRPQNLEPMPANERRIIHITLRDHRRVYTQSAGEGKRRRVRIFLKR